MKPWPIIKRFWPKKLLICAGSILDISSAGPGAITPDVELTEAEDVEEEEVVLVLVLVEVVEEVVEAVDTEDADKGTLGSKKAL